MDRVNLIAVTSLKYGRQRFAPGEPFSATRQDAKALVFIKRARRADEPIPHSTDATHYDTKDMEAVTENAESPRPKRSYRRRDLTPKT